MFETICLYFPSTVGLLFGLLFDFFSGGNTSFSVQGTNPIVAVISKLLDDRDLDIRTKVSKFFPPLNQIFIKYMINIIGIFVLTNLLLFF